MIAKAKMDELRVTVHSKVTHQLQLREKYYRIEPYVVYMFLFIALPLVYTFLRLFLIVFTSYTYFSFLEDVFVAVFYFTMVFYAKKTFNNFDLDVCRQQIESSFYYI